MVLVTVFKLLQSFPWVVSINLSSSCSYHYTDISLNWWALMQGDIHEYNCSPLLCCYSYGSGAPAFITAFFLNKINSFQNKYICKFMPLTSCDLPRKCWPLREQREPESKMEGAIMTAVWHRPQVVRMWQHKAPSTFYCSYVYKGLLFPAQPAWTLIMQSNLLFLTLL